MSLLNPKSHASVTHPDFTRVGEIDYLSCCHCGALHPVAASLGQLLQGRTVLGHCGRCNALHCPECAECVPFERQLENVEAGRDRLDTSRVRVAFPDVPPGVVVLE